VKKGVNLVILVGNVGQDPETRYLPNGGAVTNLSIATSETWRDKNSGEEQQRTDWHRVVFYQKLAEIVAEYVRKGAKLYVEGRLQTRSWEKDGQKFYATEIIANEMQMLDSKRDAAPQPRQVSGNDYRNARNGVPPASFDDESIPF